LSDVAEDSAEISLCVTTPECRLRITVSRQAELPKVGNGVDLTREPSGIPTAGIGAKQSNLIAFRSDRVAPIPLKKSGLE